MIAKSVTVSSKGQIALPVEIRKAAGIEKGDELIIIEDAGRLLVEPAKGLSKQVKEGFIDMLTLSEQALAKVWDNEEDEAWNAAGNARTPSVPVQRPLRKKVPSGTRRQQGRVQPTKR